MGGLLDWKLPHPVCYCEELQRLSILQVSELELECKSHKLWSNLSMTIIWVELRLFIHNHLCKVDVPY